MSLAEDVDPTAFADPVEQDLEHAEPLRTDERLRTDDRRVDCGDAAECFRVDLRLAVPADADQRIVFLDRMFLGHAVDGRRRDEEDPTDGGVAGGDQDVFRAADVDRADCLTRGLNRKRGRRVHDHVRALDELPHVSEVADVGSKLLDGALEFGVVQRDGVERPHLVPVREKPARQVEAEKARAAGDRPEHRAGG